MVKLLTIMYLLFAAMYVLLEILSLNRQVQAKVFPTMLKKPFCMKVLVSIRVQVPLKYKTVEWIAIRLNAQID